MPPLKQWRSLEELAGDPEFLERAVQEFPSLAEAFSTPVGRRKAIRFMAAAFATGGLAACNAGSPGGKLIPAVRYPPN
ncbi:MAG: TAT-variant-translocated molybdopterin oxidoreductase, partial [Acetobacteraceae bacterium]|nr:TAT-variant-translocated molybdopterin oxidoreductase [Acetobacteraceae bacterium]